MSATRIVIVILVLAVVGLVVATLMRDDDAPRRADSTTAAPPPDEAPRSQTPTIEPAARTVVEAQEEPDIRAADPMPATSPPRAASNEPTGEVLVTVVDAVTEKPMAGVRVTIGHADDRDEPRSLTVIDRRPTGANGQVRMLAPADIELVASLDHTLLAQVVFATPSASHETTITLRVEPSASFAGRVQTQSGEAIVGASVGVHEKLEPRRDRTRPFSFNLASGETDASGNYRVSGLRVDAGAKYVMSASAGGFTKSSSIAVEAISGALTNVAPIVLQRAPIEIVGTIVADGLDVAGRKLRVDGDRSSTQRLVLPADGHFSIGVEMPGAYTLVLEELCLDGAPSASVTVPKGVAHVDRGILHAATATTHYTGRVVRTDGVPVTGGRVQFGFTSSKIAPDGSFDLVSCFAGPQDLEVMAGDFFDARSCCEITPAFTFQATTNNELRVTPRGVLVRFVRGGKATPIDRRVAITMRCGNSTLGYDSPQLLPDAEHRLWFRRYPGIPVPKGHAEVIVTVEHLPTVTKPVELGPEGLLGPEIVVTFEHAELGLE